MNLRSPRTIAGAAALLLAATGLASGAVAPAKDYYFPEVRIEIAVAADGSFVVDEYRTFEFEGEFHYAYLVIPIKLDQGGARRAVGVSELGVTDEKGQPCPSRSTTTASG